MDIVIENFYNTININSSGDFEEEESFIIPIEDNVNKKSSILRRIIDSGVSIEEIEEISHLDEDEIKDLINR